MQLVNVDAIEAQPFQAPRQLRAVLRASVVGPWILADSIPLWSRSHDPPGRAQSLGDKFFVDVGTIGVCRVDEIDTQLNSAAKHAYRRIGVLGRPPNSRRMAPKPRRRTSNSPPSETVPPRAAGALSIFAVFSLIFVLQEPTVGEQRQRIQSNVSWLRRGKAPASKSERARFHIRRDGRRGLPKGLHGYDGPLVIRVSDTPARAPDNRNRKSALISADHGG